MAKEFKDWVDEFVENGANPKDVTNWPEQGGSGGGLKLINIFFRDAYNPYYISDFQMFVDRDGLETYEDLGNYLIEKGANLLDGREMRYPGVGFNGDDHNYFCAIYIESVDPTMIAVRGENSYKEVGNDDSFSITYLGQNQGE